MRKKREERGFSLKEVSRAVDVQVKYLEAIEHDDYVNLPARVYTFNFLKAYLHFLDLGQDQERLIKRYGAELEVRDSIQKRATGHTNKKFPFAITPSVVKMIVVAVVGGFILFYFASRLYGIFSPPIIYVIYPERNTTEINQGSIILKGRLEKSSALTVNGESVYIDDEGRFEEELFLSDGLNVFELVAVSRFNKEAREYLRITLVRQNEQEDEEQTNE